MVSLACQQRSVYHQSARSPGRAVTHVLQQQRGPLAPHEARVAAPLRRRAEDAVHAGRARQRGRAAARVRAHVVQLARVHVLT